MSDDRILCADVVREGLKLGLTVAQATRVLSDAISDLRLSVWAYRLDTPYLGLEALALPKELHRPNGFDDWSLKLQMLPAVCLPEGDEDGVGLAESKEYRQAIALWFDNLFRFDELDGPLIYCVTLREVCFSRQMAISLLRQKAELLGSPQMRRVSGRPKLYDFVECTEWVVAQVVLRPDDFRGPTGRLIECSLVPQKASIAGLAEGWFALKYPGRKAPSLSSFRRKVAKPALEILQLQYGIV